MSIRRTLRVLGTRGVPAAHSGFEAFTECLSLYLVGKGWRVVECCQDDGSGPVFEDTWQSVVRVHIAVSQDGPKGTVVFDWQATAHAANHKNLCLTLGYNAAVFCALLRLKGIPNLINIEGIEWSRMKWGPVAKQWFWLIGWAVYWLGIHLVADHSQTELHLPSLVAGGKITTMPHGADAVTSAPVEPVLALRFHSAAYVHGHQVGGTNPSLTSDAVATAALYFLVIFHEPFHRATIAGIVLVIAGVVLITVSVD